MGQEGEKYIFKAGKTTYFIRIKRSQIYTNNLLPSMLYTLMQIYTVCIFKLYRAAVN